MKQSLEDSNFSGSDYELAIAKIKDRLTQDQEKDDITAEEDFSLAKTDILTPEVEDSEEKPLLEEEEKVNLNKPELINLDFLSRKQKEDLLLKLTQRSNANLQITDNMSENAKSIVRQRIEAEGGNPEEHVWTDEHRKLMLNLMENLDKRNGTEYIPLKDR